MIHPHPASPHAAERPSGKILGAVLCALALGATGCVARAGMSTGAVVYTEPVVVVETVPVEIERYPRHYYRGNYVYLVDGRWYYRSGSRWVAYRSEPRPLASVRVHYEAKYGRHYRPRGEVSAPRPHRHDRRHHYDRD